MPPNDVSIRSVHVIAGLADVHGGPTYSVPRLCTALGEAGAKTSLFSIQDGHSSEFLSSRKAYVDRRFSADYSRVPLAKSLRISAKFRSALKDELLAADVIHNHGLWLAPNVVAGVEARRARKPLVVAPRGMLASAALAFSPKRKWLFWNFFQWPAIRGASCFHATSEDECEDIRRLGIKIPVAIIPNGIDLPEALAPVRTQTRSVLSLGRIHPKKGLDRLVQAWAGIEPDHPDWRLRIIGPAELGHDLELRNLAAQLRLSRISIEPAIFGTEKFEAYRAADIFVLPTLNENFGLTVAEALASGTPVVATKGAPWSGLEVERCGWWVDHGVEPLVQALKRMIELPQQELLAMGVRGRAWMERDFGWESVARKSIGLYTWLARGGARPDYVRIT